MLSVYNNYHHLFEKFGLSAKESQAFLELMILGASPISRWAKHTKINRSSMYVLLARLEDQRLITSFSHQGVKYVQAIPTSELPALLFDKEQSIERTRDLLVKSLPELQKLEKNYGLVPKIVFYEGEKRVETMYEHVIKEKSYKSFFHPGRIKTSMPVYFHKIPKALKANGGNAKELLINCPEAVEYAKLYSSSKHEIRTLPNNVDFSSDTIITHEKIFLVGYSDQGIVGTEIWNKELAQTQSTIFDMVWSPLS